MDSPGVVNVKTNHRCRLAWCKSCLRGGVGWGGAIVCGIGGREWARRMRKLEDGYVTDFALTCSAHFVLQH